MSINAIQKCREINQFVPHFYELEIEKICFARHAGIFQNPEARSIANKAVSNKRYCCNI